MIFGSVADLHFSDYSDNIINDIPARLYYLKETLINTIEYLLSKNIHYLITLGDTYHNKSIIHSIAMNVLHDIIKSYKNNMDFIFIDGNHDLSSKAGGVSALISLEEMSNVTVIHTPTKVDNILMVPWNPHTIVNDIKNGEADILLSHIGLNEGVLNSGISIVSEIGLKDLSHYKLVELGHYHKSQSVGNATYVGSLIQLDWGEREDEKRFLITDSDTCEFESIPSIGYKKHIELIVTNENKQDIFIEAEKFKSDGHNVRIRLHEKVDIKPPVDMVVINDFKNDSINRGITSSMTEKDKMSKYLSIKEISDDTLDMYLSVGMKIIDLSGGE